MKTNELLLVSDLDGTLVPASGTISRENLDAIARFRAKGGSFTVATGRSPASAEGVLKLLGVNTPFIANNGASICDAGSGRPIWYQPLPSSFREVVREIRETCPQVGIAAITSADVYYMVAQNDYLYFRDSVKSIDLTAKAAPEGLLPDDCCKVLFTLPPTEFCRLSEKIYARQYAGVEFVASGGECFEMMAENISKGYPLEELAKAYGRTLAEVIAVGDYYNDREMIERAGFGVAMGNAPAEIQAAAKLVVASCEENGVAELIGRLISGEVGA